jgi:hypothetical protein
MITLLHVLAGYVPVRHSNRKSSPEEALIEIAVMVAILLIALFIRVLRKR